MVTIVTHAFNCACIVTMFRDIGLMILHDFCYKETNTYTSL